MLSNEGVRRKKNTYLDHIELSNAVLLHAHRHGDTILFDQHGCA